VSERRLLVVVGTVVFVETTFFAVIAPLLPSFAHTFHLTRLSAGVLSACYAIGVLAGSVPGGILAVRAGPRFVVSLGLVLLGCATVAFAWLRSIAPLDVARAIEGVGGAFAWSGGLAWIAAGTARERRGATIGKALAAAIGGALLGPAIGALASIVGVRVMFSAFALVVVPLIVLTQTLPNPPARTDPRGGSLSGLISRSFLEPVWLMLLPSFAAGLITVLGPLRLHRLGASAVVIGAVFLIGAGLDGALAPLVGSLSDRRGRRVPLRAGMFASAIALLCFTLPDTWVLLGLLLIVTDGSLSICWGPAMALVADTADARGIDQGLAAVQMNLGWAGGQIVGSVGGGALARAAGDGLPMLTVAGLCLATVCAQALIRRR
jgi:MFS family permease